MQTDARGCTCIRRHLNEAFLYGTITWSEMGKQNIQAKKVYYKNVYIYIFLDEGIAYQQFGGNKSLKICFNGLVHLRLRISS